MPVIVAFVAIPPLIRGLGPERFAILTLGWATVGYFGLFELGLGRALTQAVARRLGIDANHELGPVAWTALLLLVAFGLVGAVVLALATPALMTDILTVPRELRGEGILAFQLLALSLPFVLGSVGLRALMEAHQHFGVATALRIPFSALTFLGPLIALRFAPNLVAVALTLVAVRVAGCLAHLVFCIRAYPYLRRDGAWHAGHLRELLRFGAWLSVSNVVSPMMVYLDRFVIGAILPMAAVTHYVTPYEGISKLMLVPTGILGAMMPAFAAAVASDTARINRLYDLSMRGVVIATFPFALVAVTLANELLRAWTGGLLPAESATVLQWLAIGVFVNAFAQPPFTVLQAAARPDLAAKLHLVELPAYLATLILLVKTFGLTGVAMTWTLRVVVDTIALVLIARRTLRLPILPERGAWLLPASLGLVVIGMVLDRTLLRLAYVALVMGVSAPAIWYGALDQVERARALGWMGRFRARMAGQTGEV